MVYMRTMQDVAARKMQTVPPHIDMLRESAPRAGFFDRDQLAAVQKNLPEPLRALVAFAFITGWRVPSEVQRLEWRQVDFDAGTIRLDPGTTKNGEGRLFPMTAELRVLLEEQDRQRKATGQIVPWVFFRIVAKGGGREKQPKPIKTFTKAWKNACRLAGCPGRIPHDFRRTAVRNLVRAGVPERVTMQMTGHKTPSVFARYNIVNEADLFDAARRYEREPHPSHTQTA
jgi:integrase